METSNTTSNTTITFCDPIRGYFTAHDRECMLDFFDLWDYESVKAKANAIYKQVNSGAMPKGGNKWPQEWLQNFKTWITLGCPEGTNLYSKPKPSVRSRATVPDRLRKNVNEIVEGSEEYKTLKKAFDGIKALPADNINSFEFLARTHGYFDYSFGGKTFKQFVNCTHHEYGFLPWHRWYNMEFENALRSIPGCEKVTLPYWDQRENPPNWLWTDSTFSSYTYQWDYKGAVRTSTTRVPVERGPNTKNPISIRASHESTVEKLQQYDVPGLINAALGTQYYEEFADFNYSSGGDKKQVEIPHDYVHVIVGDATTSGNFIVGDMFTPPLAAFDPIFWFTHAGFDKDLWSWQNQHSAITKEGFTKVCKLKDQVDEYLTEGLPFLDSQGKPTISKQFKDLLDLNKIETYPGRFESIGYSGIQTDRVFKTNIDFAAGSASAFISAHPIGSLITAKPTGALLLLKKVYHLNLKGNINVKFYSSKDSNKKLIKEQFVFLNSNPEDCPSCKKFPYFDFTCFVPSFDSNTSYSVEVSSAFTGEPIDFSDLGFPTLQISTTF